MSTHPDAARVTRTVVSIVRTDCSVGEIRMRTHPGTARVTRTFIPVVRTDRTVGEIVDLANTEPVAGVRVGAIINRWTATRRARNQVRMRTDAGTAGVTRAVVSIVRTGRSVQEVRMRADAGTACITRAIV